MYKVETTYENFYNAFGEGEHETPYSVMSGVYVETPIGYKQINEVVCKHDNPVIRLEFSDGDSFECSENHLFSSNGEYKKAYEVDEVDTSDGNTKTVTEKMNIGYEKVYDISIDNPHLYISDPESGIIHHNTFFALSIVKHFLDKNPDGLVVYFESEGAISKKMLEERGIDTKRVLIVPVMTVEEFRHQATKIAKNYEEMPDSDKRSMFFVLDSFGMLSTNKEVGDVEENKDSRDMTRAQIAKGAFRVLTLRLGKLGIPMVVTNHTYEGMTAYSPKVMGGGKGLYFACSNIIFLSKRKEKDGQSGPTIGNIITCTLRKGRLTRENSTCEVLLTYDKGLHPYHGLVDLACEAGVFKKVSTKVELPDGTSTYKKHIDKNPERYFTDDVMKRIDDYAAKKYLYGSSQEQTEAIEKQEQETEDGVNEDVSTSGV